MTNGTVFVNVNKQLLSSKQLDSSDNFKNTITFETCPSVLLIVLSTKQVIVVAFVVYTKQSVEPTAPL